MILQRFFKKKMWTGNRTENTQQIKFVSCALPLSLSKAKGKTEANSM